MGRPGYDKKVWVRLEDKIEDLLADRAALIKRVTNELGKNLDGEETYPTRP